MGFPSRSTGHGFQCWETEMRPSDGSMEKMNCSFGYALPKPYQPWHIVDAQVGSHTLTTTVGMGCVQTLVHVTALPTLAGTPTMDKTLVYVHGRRQMYEYHQLPGTVVGWTHEMAV